MRTWRDLLASSCLHDGAYPIPAYSEFMPPPRLGKKACGAEDARIFTNGGWTVTEYEEHLELQPGLRTIAEQLVTVLKHLGHNERAQGIDGRKLDGNPAWPDQLRKNGAPKHERYVIAMPLALSRTQDDKGRVRWTLFGASERPFADPGTKFWQRLAREVYGDAPYEVTFTPFADLPARTRDAYLAGDLCLLPFPGSLLFLHSPSYRKLAQQLPAAMQIPLLYSIARSESPRGIRVTQSGWMHEAEDAGEHRHGPVMNAMKRTNRWTRVHRHEDELTVLTLHQKVTHSLFSTAPEDLGLYGKPLARNAQIWTGEYELLLDGPGAGREELMRAALEVDEGGVFGYRFFYPPMRIGSYEVYWHRPVVAWDGGFLEDAPLGRVIAGDVELDPIILRRPEHLAAVHDPETRKILDATELLGELDPTFAECLLHAKRGEGGSFGFAQDRLRPDEGGYNEARTFQRTATRKFEAQYWRTIARLAHGSYINKDNADVVLDDATRRLLKHRRNDLDRLADHLLGYYEKLGVTTGWQRFEWETDFDYPWSEGWRMGDARNIITIIPGRNRKKAVIMADHYDTAYMEDKFGHTGKGPRLAAPGADDNHSATAALMLATPIFLEQELEHDIWLVHLTGEEFPADCLGARNLTRAIVERTLRLHRRRGKPLDLSTTEIAGVFVLDMVAHNNRRRRDIFQICPGWGRSSMVLAREAHRANMDWNAYAIAMNERGVRRNAKRGKRSRDPRIVPPLAKHLPLRGEVRPTSDGHSTLYNTDGQIFSDAGIPVVLFMENYDINRHGYHDSKDTMENIDLDYGAALTAIAIETVCRSAQSTNPTERSSKKSSTTPATSRPRKSKRRSS